MPRFFFDWISNGASTVDEEGAVFASDQAAEVEAIEAMFALTLDALRTATEQHFAIYVRSDSSEAVLVLELKSRLPTPTADESIGL